MKRILLIFLVLSSFIGLCQETKSQLTTRFDVIRTAGTAQNTAARIANAYQELSDGTIGVYPIQTTGTDTYLGSLIGIDSYADKMFFVVFPNANTGSSTLNINSIGAATLKKWSGGSLVNLSSGDIIADRLYKLYYDASLSTGFEIDLGGGSSTYSLTSPTTVTVGGLASGSSITGLGVDEILESIVAPYVNPTWNSFSNSQSTPVEVGTTLSGSKTFTWSLNANSGVVSTIDLYDVTATSTLLAGTANDGTQSQSITSIQLNSSGATQAWRGIANNSSPAGTVNSSNYTVTGYFYRFYGPTATAPTNSATVRALPSSAFDTGATSFTLATGTTQINFSVCLPPGRTITSVIDQTALNADITSSYVLQSSINVLDAGGTNRAYVIYLCTIAVPYGVTHNHYITYN